MKYTEFAKNIDKQSLKNVYVVSGEDGYFRDLAVKRLIQVADIKTIELNLVRYGEDEFDDFLQSLNQFPLLSDYRASIYSCLNLTDDKKDKLTKYALNPNKSSICIVSSNNSVIIKGAENVDCKKEGEALISKWIEIKFRQYKISCSPAISLQIARRCNYDMGLVSNVVNMLADFKDEEKVIYESDVDLLAPSIMEEEIFKIINAIVEKNVKSVFVGINKLKAQKVDDLQALSMLYGSFRRMFFSITSNLSLMDIAKVLGVKEYSMIKAKELARKYSASSIRRAMTIISNAEISIKQGNVTNKNVIFDVAIKLIA